METIKIPGLLEIYKSDLGSSAFTYKGALVEVAKLGDGWRLPNIVEIDYLYKLYKKYGIGDFKYNIVDGLYWLSDSAVKNFSFLYGSYMHRTASMFVEVGFIRPVRSIKNEG